MAPTFAVHVWWFCQVCCADVRKARLLHCRRWYQGEKNEIISLVFFLAFETMLNLHLNSHACLQLLSELQVLCGDKFNVIVPLSIKGLRNWEVVGLFASLQDMFSVHLILLGSCSRWKGEQLLCPKVSLWLKILFSDAGTVQDCRGSYHSFKGLPGSSLWGELPQLSYLILFSFLTLRWRSLQSQ